MLIGITTLRRFFRSMPKQAPLAAGAAQPKAPISLLADGLPQELTRLRAGGVYWLACDGVSDADRLAAWVLRAAGTLPHAVLATLGRPPTSVLEAIPVDAGPVSCSPFRTSTGRLPRAFAQLRGELARAVHRGTGLCVVTFPAGAVDALDDAALAEWSGGIAAWAASRGCVVVLVCHGEAGGVVPRLSALNRVVAGVAQLLPHRGRLHYAVHYWANELGVMANRDVAVEWHDGGLRRVELEEGRPLLGVRDGSDAMLYLAEAAVLEGAPPVSSAWRLFDNRSGLMARAMHASMATVIFSIRQSREVDGLARAISQLRRERGRGLKLVVRELAPCMRHVDERLLMRFGANLVVHADMPLSRFVTLLESVQGQEWRGGLPDDLERQLLMREPPDVGGVISVRQFRRLALAMLHQDGVTDHVVLGLPVAAGLTPEHALRQCRIQRGGDLACGYRREVRLFLFACRRDGIEQALDNLFLLPWRDLFGDYRVLDAFTVAEMVDDSLDEAPDHPADADVLPTPPAADDHPQPLRPRRLTLGAWR